MPRVTTVRLADDVAARLDMLAMALDRSRAWVIEQAITRYIDSETHFLEAVEEGILASEAGDVIDHAVIVGDLEEFRTLAWRTS